MDGPEKKNSSKKVSFGSRTGSPVSNNPSRIQSGTGQHQNQRLNPVTHQILFTKTQHYHNRGDFVWAKQTEKESPEELWKRLIKLEKECNFNTISVKEVLISKDMTAFRDKKLREKLMKGKNI